MTRDNDQRRKNLHLWNCHVTMAKKDACKSNEMQVQNRSLAFIHKIKSLPPATSILSRSPLAHNTTATLDKPTCTNYVVLGKCQERFGRILWSKNDSNYLDNKLKVFKREEKIAEFWLRQNFTIGETDFNQFVRQGNQLVVATDNFLREQNLTPLLQSTQSKDVEEELKLVHKVFDVVDCPNRRICVTWCDTRWTTQKLPLLKFVYSDGRRRKKNFSKLCMSTINLTNLYLFLTSWIRCMIK